MNREAQLGESALQLGVELQRRETLASAPDVSRENQLADLIQEIGGGLRAGPGGGVEQPSGLGVEVQGGLSAAQATLVAGGEHLADLQLALGIVVALGVAVALGRAGGGGGLRSEPQNAPAIRVVPAVYPVLPAEEASAADLVVDAPSRAAVCKDEADGEQDGDGGDGEEDQGEGAVHGEFLGNALDIVANALAGGEILRYPSPIRVD